MMGTQTRSFTPLPQDVSLEELVPEDHFYRCLEAKLDLSFVRELVAPLYAGGGRPSVDPIVFFKLQMVMFFEDLHHHVSVTAVRREASLAGRADSVVSPCERCLEKAPILAFNWFAAD